MLQVIGITGLAGSGKDTLAEMLINMSTESDISNLSGYHYSFADPVKKVASVMFGVPEHMFYDRDLKETINIFWGISPRKMAQLVGTDMARNCFNDQIWIMRAKAEMKSIALNMPHVEFIVIPDVRFDNEADFIREMDGKLIHIDRPNQKVIEESDHESENGITFKKGDVEFVNGSTLMELELLAKAFYLHEIKKDKNAKHIIEKILNETPEIKASY